MTDAVSTVESQDHERQRGSSDTGGVLVIVRPTGSLLALGLAVIASTLPLTGHGLGSGTASATALGLAWDSARANLRIAAFAGAMVLLLAALLTTVSVIPGAWPRRIWLALVATYVVLMGLSVVALRSNSGSAVVALAVGAVILCTTTIVELAVNHARYRSTPRQA